MALEGWYSITNEKVLGSIRLPSPVIKQGWKCLRGCLQSMATLKEAVSVLWTQREKVFIRSFFFLDHAQTDYIVHVLYDISQKNTINHYLCMCVSFNYEYKTISIILYSPTTWIAKWVGCSWLLVSILSIFSDFSFISLGFYFPKINIEKAYLIMAVTCSTLLIRSKMLVPCVAYNAQ